MSTAILAPGSRGRRLSKRLLQVVITLFGLLLLTFTIGRVMPIDPVLAIVGPDADQSTYQQVYQQLGFDKSLTTQFGIYFVNLLHGDLGNALLTGKPVVDDIIRVFPATLVFRWACWRRRGAIASPIMWYALSAWRATRRRSFGSG